MDNTFVVIKSAYKNEFLDHINSIDEGIQFTAENTRADSFMPFLDTLAIPEPDGSLTTTVFRKPTHTYQYLQWDNQHAISAKYSVISTLLHRAKAVCSTTQYLGEEQDHLQNVLTRCKYPTWGLNRIKSKIRAPTILKRATRVPKQSTRNSSISNKQRGYVVATYTKGLS